MNTTDNQVFLCHASEDKDTVLDVYNVLKKRGYNPWLDKKNLLAGQDWEREIQQAIKHSSFMIIFLSKFSVSKRGYVQKEFRIGLDTLKEIPSGQIFIIPVRLDDCEIPYEFKHLHCADLFQTNGIESVIKSLDIGIHQFKTRKANIPEKRGTPKQNKSRKKTTKEEKVLWRHEVKSNGSGTYSIYFDGEYHSGTRFMWSGKEDAIIYDPKSRKYYELKGYKKHTDGKLRPAILTTVPGRVLWRSEKNAKGETSYNIYLNGKQLSGTRVLEHGMADAIIYHPKSGKYYELKGYKKYSDGKLRLATLTTIPD